jgi:minor curlin subunit
MSRISLLAAVFLLSVMNSAFAQMATQNAPFNFGFGFSGGSQSSIDLSQSGFVNVYYGVQDSNQANQAVVTQNGLNNYSQMQQVGDSTGAFSGSANPRGDVPRYGGQNYAAVTQNGLENSSQITQMGGTNVAAVAQNSHVGNGSAPRVLVPTDGPIYQSYQTPEGYLSLFATDSMSLAIWTPPGLTATNSFGRMH